jgi:class 3 adenylate cyclase
MTVLTRGSFQPYLPRLVVDWANAGTPLGAREIDGSLVSLDISGFTRLSEQLQAKGRAGAEELVLLVSGVFQGLIGIAERRGGDVLKFRGDALLLFFPGDGHEVRACRAASEMQWLIENAGQTMSSVGAVTLRMSVGIHSGTCAFFLVEGTHRELVIAGPAATATIGLESDAEAGEILVGPQTAAALDPAWLGAEKGSGRLLVPTEPEPDDVVAHLAQVGTELDLAGYVPESLRAHLVLESGEAEHRQVTAAFLKFGAADELPVPEFGARLTELARFVGDTLHELGSRGSSRTSTSAAASSISSPARPRRPVPTRTACCARCARSSTATTRCRFAPASTAARRSAATSAR